jgi:hypothetical protein
MRCTIRSNSASRVTASLVFPKRRPTMHRFRSSRVPAGAYATDRLRSCGPLRGGGRGAARWASDDPRRARWSAFLRCEPSPVPDDLGVELPAQASIQREGSEHSRVSVQAGSEVCVRGRVPDPSRHERALTSREPIRRGACGDRKYFVPASVT